jgi:hypothetical protein
MAHVTSRRTARSPVEDRDKWQSDESLNSEYVKDIFAYLTDWEVNEKMKRPFYNAEMIKFKFST